MLRQGMKFSTRSPYANKKVMETYFSRVNIGSESAEDMIEKLQILKGKIKTGFYQKIKIYYD